MILDEKVGVRRVRRWYGAYRWRWELWGPDYRRPDWVSLKEHGWARTEKRARERGEQAVLR